MPQVEITELPALSPAERSIVNGHALLNLYNLLCEELATFGSALAGDPELLAASVMECALRADRLSDSNGSVQDAIRVGQLETLLQRELAVQLARLPRRAGDPAVIASRTHLDALLWILQVRARELVARTTAPTRACSLSISDLETDFQELFRIMQQNARERFRFVYNLAAQQPQDYYVDLRFESERGTPIAISTLFKDVMRDLVANARKFTAPGGQIRIALHSCAHGQHLVVEDTGRGIPATDLPAVVKFGRRGSNVSDVRSFGAGCGLTKAVVVTRELGGRIWIASEEGRGTRVRIWLPASGTRGERPGVLQD